MELALQLIADEICGILKSKLSDMDINVQEVLEIKSYKILKSIQDILANEQLSDFDVVEQIVCLLEENGLYCGGCHDFG